MLREICSSMEQLSVRYECVVSGRANSVVCEPSWSTSATPLHRPLSADLSWNACSYGRRLRLCCQCRFLDGRYVKKHQQVFFMSHSHQCYCLYDLFTLVFYSSIFPSTSYFETMFWEHYSQLKFDVW